MISYILTNKKQETMPILSLHPSILCIEDFQRQQQQSIIVIIIIFIHKQQEKNNNTAHDELFE